MNYNNKIINLSLIQVVNGLPYKDIRIVLFYLNIKNTKMLLKIKKKLHAFDPRRVLIFYILDCS
jgi:hypothetical protein